MDFPMKNLSPVLVPRPSGSLGISAVWLICFDGIMKAEDIALSLPPQYALLPSRVRRASTEALFESGDNNPDEKHHAQFPGPISAMRNLFFLSWLEEKPQLF